MFIEPPPQRQRSLFFAATLILSFVFAADICLGQRPSDDDVVRIIDLLKGAGVQDVGLVTDVPERR